MAGQYRHEQKYYINYATYHILRNRLKVILRPDENAGKDGTYHIRSLYYDDLYESSLTTKIAGLDERAKYRVRIYNYSNKVIRLERKAKKGAYILKHSCGLSLPEYEALRRNDVSFLLSKAKPPCGAVYAAIKNDGLRPVKVVDYRREAYIHPIEDVRITFDMDLRMGTDFNIFDPHIFTVPMLEKGQMILEIKFNKFMPGFIRDIFMDVESTPSAISKYAICRKFDV